MIKPSIKADIQSNRYVDLSLLIALEEQSTYELVCEQPDCDNNFASKLKWSQKNAFAIKNSHQWTDAFNTFMAINCERFPGEAFNLMKYMSTVRNIARKKGDWVQYKSYKVSYIRWHALNLLTKQLLFLNGTLQPVGGDVIRKVMTGSPLTIKRRLSLF